MGELVAVTLQQRIHIDARLLREERILQEVIDRSQADTEMSGRLTVEAGRITAEVTRAHAAEETLSGRITVEAGKITQIVSSVGADGKVTAASICLAINNGGSSATINADKIYLLGQTIANQITADYIQSKVSTLAALGVKTLRVGSNGYITFEGGDGATITGAQAADIIRNLKITQSGNTYTLQKIVCGDGIWQDVGSFSRAVASWSVGGGSGKVNVTANPQGQTKSVPVSIGGPNSISSNGTYTYKVYYENDSGDDVETGASMSVNVSADAHPNHRTLHYEGYEFSQSEFIHKWTTRTSGSGRPGPSGSGDDQTFYW